MTGDIAVTIIEEGTNEKEKGDCDNCFEDMTACVVAQMSLNVASMDDHTVSSPSRSSCPFRHHLDGHNNEDILAFIPLTPLIMLQRMERLSSHISLDKRLRAARHRQAARSGNGTVVIVDAPCLYQLLESLASMVFVQSQQDSSM